MDQVRLNKYLAHSFGISRREADHAIEQGRARVNGRTVQLGKIIQPARDTVTLDNDTADVKPKRYTYLLLNKPVGYVCSRKQQGDAPTIYTLLPRQHHHLKVAGQLDKDSCGLVLLTDDGDTIFKLTHPKFAKEKVYHVGLNKPLKLSDKKKIEAGIELDDGVSTLKIQVIKSKMPNMYKITMTEGRNRQIRRTFKALGYTVTHLERTGFGRYRLSQLQDKPYLHI